MIRNIQRKKIASLCSAKPTPAGCSFLFLPFEAIGSESSQHETRIEKKGRFIKPMKKKIPQFKNEDQERKFWLSQDSTEYVDWKKAKRMVLPKLKPSIKTISLRLPEAVLEELKLIANKRDVPYQSLLKMFLAERIEQELNR
jgi:predicted DNA binding CopG/RHH family protein